jgi:hypothetical protein
MSPGSCFTSSCQAKSMRLFLDGYLFSLVMNDRIDKAIHQQKQLPTSRAPATAGSEGEGEQDRNEPLDI